MTIVVENPASKPDITSISREEKRRVCTCLSVVFNSIYISLYKYMYIKGVQMWTLMNCLCIR